MAAKVSSEKISEKADRIILRHNGENLFHLGYGTGKDNGGFATSAHFTLMPGVNEIPGEVWEKVKAHPVVIHHMKGRKPMFELERGLKKGEQALAKMSVEDALEFIGDTWRDDLLSEWLASEKRAKVRDALQAQRDKLDPSKDRGDD